MGVRTGSTVAATTLLICSGCGHSLADIAPKTTTAAHPQTAATSPVPPSIAAPYVPAGPQWRSLAAAFVRATCTYNAGSEEQLDFLARATPLTTESEAQRLKVSQRARLNWPAMRARHERTQMTFTGISQESGPVGVRLVVEFVRTTITDFTTVREFAEMSLDIAETVTGPRVTAAKGAGL